MQRSVPKVQILKGSEVSCSNLELREWIFNILNHIAIQYLDIYLFGGNDNGELGLGPAAGPNGVYVDLPHLGAALAGIRIYDYKIGRKTCYERWK